MPLLHLLEHVETHINSHLVAHREELGRRSTSSTLMLTIRCLVIIVITIHIGTIMAYTHSHLAAQHLVYIQAVRL